MSKVQLKEYQVAMSQQQTCEYTWYVISKAVEVTPCLLGTPQGRAMHLLKGIGPKREPWATPHSFLTQLDLFFYKQLQ